MPNTNTAHTATATNKNSIISSESDRPFLVDVEDLIKHLKHNIHPMLEEHIIKYQNRVFGNKDACNPSKYEYASANYFNRNKVGFTLSIFQNIEIRNGKVILFLIAKNTMHDYAAKFYISKSKIEIPPHTPYPVIYIYDKITISDNEELLINDKSLVRRIRQGIHKLVLMHSYLDCFDNMILESKTLREHENNISAYKDNILNFLPDNHKDKYDTYFKKQIQYKDLSNDTNELVPCLREGAKINMEFHNFDPHYIISIPYQIINNFKKLDRHKCFYYLHYRQNNLSFDLSPVDNGALKKFNKSMMKLYIEKKQRAHVRYRRYSEVNSIRILVSNLFFVNNQLPSSINNSCSNMTRSLIAAYDSLVKNETSPLPDIRTFSETLTGSLSIIYRLHEHYAKS